MIDIHLLSENIRNALNQSLVVISDIFVIAFFITSLLFSIFIELAVLFNAIEIIKKKLNSILRRLRNKNKK